MYYQPKYVHKYNNCARVHGNITSVCSKLTTVVKLITVAYLITAAKLITYLFNCSKYNIQSTCYFIQAVFYHWTTSAEIEKLASCSPNQRLPLFAWAKNLYLHCLVLVGSRNVFNRDFKIELKQIQGLMEDWLKITLKPTTNAIYI